jgi:Trpc4-associated protein
LNQELLLSVPGFLYRLVNLVRRKDYAIRYPNTANELDHWMRYIDAALSDDDENPTDSSNGDNTLFDDIRFQPALLAAAKLNNFVHVLYTLSLLLIGKERKKVQKILTKIKLASALNSLFDYLIWNCRCEYPPDSIANQIRSHICPEVAVKIQFLRLIHSFCDNSE